MLEITFSESAYGYLRISKGFANRETGALIAQARKEKGITQRDAGAGAAGRTPQDVYV